MIKVRHVHFHKQQEVRYLFDEKEGSQEWEGQDIKEGLQLVFQGAFYLSVFLSKTRRMII